MTPPRSSRDIMVLLDLMAALRTSGTGCPWDLQQTSATIAPYAIEEACEVVDAIERGDLDDLRDELGDLLLQVVFHARMAEEQQAFDFGAVVEAITGKLIRRHPHVFGETRDLSPEAVKTLWAEIKARERADKASLREPADAPPASLLDGVPLALPSLARADKLTRKAAAVGFTWPDAASVLDKVDEEWAELREAVRSGSKDAIRDEIGDVIFTLANLARQLDIDSEAALRGTNRKFERRFRSVERALADLGRSPATSTLDEMDRLWDRAKAEEMSSEHTDSGETGRVTRPDGPSGTD